MPHDNMKKIKKTILYAWSSIAFAMSFFSILYGILNLLYKLGVLTSNDFILPISLPLSLIAGIVLTVLIIKNDFALFWLGKNGITINLALILAGMFLASFQTEVILPKNQLKELITVEWMIFAIAITIFVLLVSRFKGLVDSAKPKKEEQNIYKRLVELDKKLIIHVNISAMFAMILLLFINVISLVFSTAFIYLITDEFTILSQNIVLFSFFSSVSVILNLFIEIIRPLYETKKKREKDLIVSKEDIQVYGTSARAIDDILKEYKEIENKLEHKNNLSLEEIELIRKRMQRLQEQTQLFFGQDEEMQQEDK